MEDVNVSFPAVVLHFGLGEAVQPQTDVCEPHFTLQLCVLNGFVLEQTARSSLFIVSCCVNLYWTFGLLCVCPCYSELQNMYNSEDRLVLTASEMCW